MFSETIFGEDYYSIYTSVSKFEMPKIKLGKGRTLTGKRKSSGPRNMYFRHVDILKEETQNNSEAVFKRRYCGYTPKEVEYFFNTFADKFNKPNATRLHSRNKLLLWLDFLKGTVSPNHPDKISKWKIKSSTQFSFVREVTQTIVEAYENSDVLSLPDDRTRKMMQECIQMDPTKALSNVLFVLDGAHKRCKGHKHRESLSWKYKWLPCYNIMFVVERVTGTIVAFTLHPHTMYHTDTTMLESSDFAEKYRAEWGPVLVDSGYANNARFAAIPGKKKHQHLKTIYSKQFFRKMKRSRMIVEQTFGIFFTSKFPRLGHWQGTGKYAFSEWSDNVVAAMILFNVMKRYRKGIH